MRIGYFGDGVWAHLAIEKLSADDRFEIAYIVPRHDKQDPVLKKWATKLGVPFLLLEDINSSESLSILSKYETDLNISMSFNQIPDTGHSVQGFLAITQDLPFYRRNILTWL